MTQNAASSGEGVGFVRVEGPKSPCRGTMWGERIVLVEIGALRAMCVQFTDEASEV